MTKTLKGVVRGIGAHVPVALTIAGMTLASLPLTASASLFRRNDYQVCTRELIEDGINAEVAASACAEALEPKDIADCVDDIASDTAIASDEALASCVRVRRPEDMADCVTRIDGSLEAAVPQEVLDNCTRSLLPDDYAECVVGVDRETDFLPTDIMQTCIAADYRLPPRVYPNFEPASPDADIILEDDVQDAQ